MKAHIARVAGFCMGVRRAMDMALDTSRREQKPVYTFGPLIHNPSALHLLESRGVKTLRDIPEKGEGIVIIRAHGVSPDVKQRLTAAGFSIVDATCPRVVKVQMLARHYARKGLTCILIGDKGHPEVVGILGHTGEKGLLVSSKEDIDCLPSLDRYVILVQTTQDRERFERWSQEILFRNPGGKVINTICDSTSKRQHEVRRLSSGTDLVVVVGGRESANTKRLAEIVKECGKPCMAVETEEDLDRDALRRFRSVGVTAGASTPNWVINRVAREIENTRSPGEPVLGHTAYRIFRFFHMANLWTALAGACLALAASLLDSRNLSPLISMTMAFCYIYPMHTLNRLIDVTAGVYNDPERAQFLGAHRPAFFAISFSSLIFCHLLAWSMGPLPFFLLLVITALGIIHTAPVIPFHGKNRAIRDLPGSKPLFIALAWGAVTVILPRADLIFPAGAVPWIIFVPVAITVYMRSILMEILDVQGDRIAGRETLTLLIGEKRTARLVRILAASVVFASLIPMVGEGSPLFLAFLPFAAWMYVLSGRIENKRIRQNIWLEFFVEFPFFSLPIFVICLKAIFR